MENRQKWQRNNSCQQIYDVENTMRMNNFTSETVCGQGQGMLDENKKKKRNDGEKTI